MIGPDWAKLAAVMALMAGSYYMGYSNASTSERLDVSTRDNGAWVERSVLQAKLSASDKQLATAQATIMQGVAFEVTKREVIYLDRIKDPATAKCVADSGLLELIDAANGVAGAKR